MIFAHIIYKILTFLTMVLLARFLGAEGFGRLSFGLSAVWIFLFLSDMGLSDLFTRDVASDNRLKDKYVDHIVTIKIFLGIISYLIIFLIGLSYSFNKDTFWAVLILGLATILDSFMYFFRCIFRIKEIMKYEAILMVIEGFLKISVLLAAIRFESALPGIIIISLAILLISSLNLILNFLAFVLVNRLPTLRFDWNFSLYLLKNSFPFAIVYMLNLLNFRVDIIMLTVLSSAQAAGLYSASFKLIEQLLLIPLTFSCVILPTFSKPGNSLLQMKHFLKGIVPILILTSIAAIILLNFSGDYIIRSIYGNGFQGAAANLKIFSLVLLPFFLKPIPEKLLLGARMQNTVCSLYCGGIILNIIKNFIFIPVWGINGATLGTFFCEMLVVFGCIIIVYKRGVLSQKLSTEVSLAYKTADLRDSEY